MYFLVDPIGLLTAYQLPPAGVHEVLASSVGCISRNGRKPSLPSCLSPNQIRMYSGNCMRMASPGLREPVCGHFAMSMWIEHAVGWRVDGVEERVEQPAATAPQPQSRVRFKMNSFSPCRFNELFFSRFFLPSSCRRAPHTHGQPSSRKPVHQARPAERNRPGLQSEPSTVV